MATWIILGAVVALYVRRRLRKARRNDSTEALSSVLGMRMPYKGPRWRAPRRWL